VDLGLKKKDKRKYKIQNKKHLNDTLPFALNLFP